VFDQGSLSRDASFLANTSELSISCWYKNSVGSPIFSIWGVGSNDFSLVTGWGDGTQIGMGFFTDSSGGFYSFAEGSAIPDDGQYHHVVMVYSSSNSSFKAFVDGNLIGSESITGALCTAESLSQLVLGSEADRVDAFSASIDAVGIWNRALSDAEVAELYNNGSGLELEVQAPVVDLEDGLQAFYKLSDTSDSSGNNRTLTNNGNVSFASGKLGNAAVFDGSNYLDADVSSLSIDQSNPFSVSFWSNPSANVVGTTVGGNGFNIHNDNEGALHFNNSQAADCYVANAFEVGVWKHYVCMLSNGNCIVYINGQEAYNQQSNVSYQGILNTLFIGNVLPWSLLFNGQIDAVGIWNRALSDSEVTALYNSGTGLELEGSAAPTLVKMQAPVKFFGKVKFGV
jgi:hypothetical protein